MTNKEALQILNIDRLTYCEEEADRFIEAYNMALKALEQQKIGEWKAFTHSAFHGVDDFNDPIWKPVTVYHCPFCNRKTVIKDNFCHNCGARMNGGNKNE